MFNKYWQGEQARYDFVNISTTDNVVTGELCKPSDHCVCAGRYTDEMVSNNYDAECCHFVRILTHCDCETFVFLCGLTYVVRLSGSNYLRSENFMQGSAHL